MGFVIRGVSDEEVSRVCEIESLAYQNSPLSPILAPGPFPPDSRQQRVDEMINKRKEDPSAVYLQVFDEETENMVAFAKWHIFETAEAVAANSRPIILDEGRNKEACMLLYGGLKDRKKEIMGNKPHLYLHMLSTDPAFQGKGAGGMLVDWGTRKADELNLPAYLESSAAGRRVYQKRGFRDIEVFKVDFSPFGGTLHEQPLMLREPSK
ncbi:acyl-CoA N-acyltransferase [Pyrenochaeta sp. MPI-SDFR-AT-0127]|nr:acyl-CoA N-acyltransferase [Pyrenochaeta sp. MPI-SDFR-AT-0127]